MRIIAKRVLYELARKHADSVPAVDEWYAIARKAGWHSHADVRALFPSADPVGDKTVFNIKGNKYRLIVHINYQLGTILIKDLLTHAEYDKGKWKT